MKKARTLDGKPTFLVLHAVDANGKQLPVPPKSLPSFHGFRHTAASEAIRDGESAEEVSWQLGHRDSTVTRKVYVHEIKSVERSHARRAKYEARLGGILRAVGRSKPGQGADSAEGELITLGSAAGRGRAG
jgi:integrase